MQKTASIIADNIVITLVLLLVSAILIAGCISPGGAQGNVTSETGWVTHTYENLSHAIGLALSFDTPADWVATGPIAEGIGGWYDPTYPKPLSAEAVWCYWTGLQSDCLDCVWDLLEINQTQKKVSTTKTKGGWTYHLACVVPVGIYDQKAQILDRILASLTPLSENTSEITPPPSGVPAAPSVTCSIDAEVLDVEKKNTNFNEPALSQGRKDFDYYLIKVNISNISTFDSRGGGSCDDAFIKIVEDQGMILQLQDYESNPLTEGQKIKAYVKFGGDEWFGGYFGTISKQ